MTKDPGNKGFIPGESKSIIESEAQPRQGLALVVFIKQHSDCACIHRRIMKREKKMRRRNFLGFSMAIILIGEAPG